MDEILVSDTARDDFLGQFEGTGVAIAGLNCNGNPLHPNPEIGSQHAEDIRRSIRLAQRLGQHRVVTMSGLPGGEPGTTRPNWIVNAWNSAAVDVLDYQWQVAADFWRETDRLARDHDVKVALELHPQNVVFNSASMHQLVELTGATHVGVELDASHLFWQQMDPVAVVRHLGDLVSTRLRRMCASTPRTSRSTVSWTTAFAACAPMSPAPTWVATNGRTNGRRMRRGTSWRWARDMTRRIGPSFLRALHDVDPDMMVNIEHEDIELGRIEGIEVAANVLIAADAALQASLPTSRA